MSSPFQKKFCSKTPFRQEQEFVETRFQQIDGQKIPTRREMTIPGEERLTFEQVGVDPREGKKYWQENPEEYKKYLESKAPKTIIQERDVNLRKTPGSFKPGKFFGLTLSPDMPEEMPMENIQNIYRRAFEQNKGNRSIQEAIQKDFKIYLKEAGYSIDPTAKTKVSEWRDVKSGN